MEPSIFIIPIPLLFSLTHFDHLMFVLYVLYCYPSVYKFFSIHSFEIGPWPDHNKHFPRGKSESEKNKQSNIRQDKYRCRANTTCRGGGDKERKCKCHILMGQQVSFLSISGVIGTHIRWNTPKHVIYLDELTKTSSFTIQTFLTGHFSPTSLSLASIAFFLTLCTLRSWYKLSTSQVMFALLSVATLSAR